MRAGIVLVKNSTARGSNNNFFLVRWHWRLVLLPCLCTHTTVDDERGKPTQKHMDIAHELKVCDTARR